MSVFVNKSTRLLVQGITGREGSFHARQMLEYGTQVVGGVTPGKGGQLFEGKVPVFNTVADAVTATGADTAVVYVPPTAAASALFEAADAGISLIVCITEGIPVQHVARAMPYVRARGVRLIGPNCPGLITPGEAKVGIIPGSICKPGRVGIVSRSGTLTYEIVNHLTKAGIGQSTCVGIGGDPLIGTNFIDVLRAFQDDPGHRCHRDDGRDRRHRRAAGGRVHQGARHQAGGRVHCRTDGAQGATDGSCRRDHLGFVGHGRGKAGRIRRRRDGHHEAAGGRD